MIYTGFFDKTDVYEEKGLTPVSIAGRAPENYHGFEYRKLAPKYDWWKKWHDEGLGERWYRDMYQQTVLDKLSARDVYDDLMWCCFAMKNRENFAIGIWLLTGLKKMVLGFKNTD